MNKKQTILSVVGVCFGIGLAVSTAQAKVVIQGDLSKGATETDDYLAGKTDEFASLVGNEWTVIKQFLAADPTRYNGIRTENNEHVFELNEAILKHFDGNPYFAVNETFGGAIRIDPRSPYAIKVGDVAIQIKEGEGDLTFNVRLRGYAEQEELRLKKEGTALLLDPEGPAPTKAAEAIIIENGRVMYGNNAALPVNLLPKKTAEKILGRFKKADLLGDLQLIAPDEGTDTQTGTQTPVLYKAVVQKHGRILGLIPVEVEVRIGVDAEKQVVSSSYAPWWDIFVF